MFPVMRSASLTKIFSRSTILCEAARSLFFGFLLLPCLALFTPTHAQDFVPEQFNKDLMQETLKDQEILREEMILEQEILREEMEQIRLEMQRIMREIALSMKEEALKLKAELEGLQGETQRIKEEIMAALEKSKQDFADGQDEMRKELQKMRQEAKTLTNEIKEVLDEQKEVWKQETAALQGSLVEARNEMNSAKVDTEEALQSSRSASNDIKKEQKMTLDDSRAKSDAAMFEAGTTFKKSQNDYKQASKSITQELMADMKETRETMQRKQKAQKQDSKNTQQEVLAALKNTKKQRIAELKRDSTKNKLRKKKYVRSAKKQTRKQKLRKKPKGQKTKRQPARRKTEKRIDTKSDSKQLDLAIKEGQVLPDTREKPEVVVTPKTLDEALDENEVVTAAKTPAKPSEESPQEKASRFSKNIASLKSELKKKSGDPGALFAKLGDAYLEAQHFINSQKDDEERQKIFNLSDNQSLLLGSYEQAAWAYKLSLTFNHKNAETHLKIGKIYAEMGDGRNALMHAKLAHQIFKKRDNSKQMKETQTFIEMLTSKYKDKLEKNSA
jgi:hypothetical protein